MRRNVLPPVLTAALVATGLALVTSAPSEAAPVKLYFHSAAGGYLMDFAADPQGPVDDSAPDGATLDAKAPTGTTDAEARGGSPLLMPGSPVFPTFTLPFTGDVTSVCLDVWVKSTMYVPAFDLAVVARFNTPDDIFDLGEAAVTDYTNGDLVRITAEVKPVDVAKYTIAKDSEFIISGYPDTDNDLTLVYDSVEHPSSITINPTECKATPIVVPSGTTSPTPGGSSSPTPGGSVSPTPGGSATPTPGGSATPTASVTASPSASPTPPPPAAETGIDYTGASWGHYTDSPPVSAKVTLPDGTPVPTGRVEFAVGSDRVTLPVNSSGVASGRLPLRSSAPGDYVMTVRYVANSAYLGSAEQAPFKVLRMPTGCAIGRSTSGGYYVVTGTLRDRLGRAVVGQALTFWYNGRAFRSVRTDRNGRAQATAPIRSGTYTVSLPATTHYLGCSASFRV
ncbi:MAG TPA: hypothetical protein VF519_18390 [Mycobacteriales bacterium]|jgi:hypothetical protein